MKRISRNSLRHLRLAEGRHQSEPTCDNCLWMTIVGTASGNHRHCDQMGLYIPDHDIHPTCQLHHRTSRISRTLAAKGGEL